MTGDLTLTGNKDVIIQGTGNLSVGGNATVGADLTVDSDTLYVDSTDSRVAMGHTDPKTKLHIKGTGWASNTLGSNLLRLEATGNTGSAIALENANGQLWNIYNGGSSSWAGQGNLGFVYGDGTNAATDYKIAFTSGGNILPGADSDQDFGADGTRWQNIYGDIVHALNSVRIAKGSANQEADIHLRGGGSGNGGGRGFRLGSNIGGGADLFEIYSSVTNGDDDWKSLSSGEPALAIQGANNRVGINTNTFSGTDTSTTPNTTRNYILNVNGDMNLDGQLFQNNEEFVTSRWTEATNQTDIYRLSKVGINVVNPTDTLQISGNVNIEGSTFTSGQNTSVLEANGETQYIDSKGIIKRNSKTVDESITVGANDRCMSTGPVEVTGSAVVTVSAGGVWVVL